MSAPNSLRDSLGDHPDHWLTTRSQGGRASGWRQLRYRYSLTARADPFGVHPSGGLRPYVFSHTINHIDVELGAHLFRLLLK